MANPPKKKSGTWLGLGALTLVLIIGIFVAFQSSGEDLQGRFDRLSEGGLDGAQDAYTPNLVITEMYEEGVYPEIQIEVKNDSEHNYEGEFTVVLLGDGTDEVHRRTRVSGINAGEIALFDTLYAPAPPYSFYTAVLEIPEGQNENRKKGNELRSAGSIQWPDLVVTDVWQSGGEQSKVTISMKNQGGNVHGLFKLDESAPWPLEIQIGNKDSGYTWWVAEEDDFDGKLRRAGGQAIYSIDYADLAGTWVFSEPPRVDYDTQGLSEATESKFEVCIDTDDRTREGLVLEIDEDNNCFQVGESGIRVGAPL
jgi:hypothetical protein